MTLYCNECGKELSPSSEPVRIYASYSCGIVAYCFEHDKGMPDFGKNVCRICGSELSTLKRERRSTKPKYFCMKCGSGRSGKNATHLHGKGCQIDL